MPKEIGWQQCIRVSIKPLWLSMEEPTLNCCVILHSSFNFSEPQKKTSNTMTQTGNSMYEQLRLLFNFLKKVENPIWKQTIGVARVGIWKTEMSCQV